MQSSEHSDYPGQGQPSPRASVHGNSPDSNTDTEWDQAAGLGLIPTAVMEQANSSSDRLNEETIPESESNQISSGEDSNPASPISEPLLCRNKDAKLIIAIDIGTR
jgi:hypothetical protein